LARPRGLLLAAREYVACLVGALEIVVGVEWLETSVFYAAFGGLPFSIPDLVQEREVDWKPGLTYLLDTVATAKCGIGLTRTDAVTRLNYCFVLCLVR
jgi:hypothetical protein